MYGSNKIYVCTGPQKKLFYVGIPHISGKNSKLQHIVKNAIFLMSVKIRIIYSLVYCRPDTSI